MQSVLSSNQDGKCWMAANKDGTMSVSPSRSRSIPRWTMWCPSVLSESSAARPSLWQSAPTWMRTPPIPIA